MICCDLPDTLRVLKGEESEEGKGEEVMREMKVRWVMKVIRVMREMKLMREIKMMRVRK